MRETVDCQVKETVAHDISFDFFQFLLQKNRISQEPITVRAHFGQSNFLFFKQKRKKEILLIVIIFTYFKVQKKIEKKNGQEN